jgi:acetyl esterase/lipase
MSAATLRKRSLGLLLGCSLLALASSPAALAATKSKGGRADEPVYRSLSYGPSPVEVADVYPSIFPHSTTIVLVHGGGWRKQGELTRLEAEARSLQRAGLTVFNINYDQDSPTTPAFPLEPNAVEAAIRWAVANTSRFNGNPANVVLIGGSAGGHLVAVAAEQLSASNPGMIRGVISLSGPMNFVSLWPKLEDRTIENENFKLSVERALGMESTHKFPSSFAAEWSPALHAPAKSCPAWLLINSSSETIPLSQAEEMNNALHNAKCQSSLIVMPGGEHSFMYWYRVRRAIGEFIAAQ